MPQRAAFQFGAEAVCRLCNQQQEKQRDTGIKTINKMSPGVAGDGIVKLFEFIRLSRAAVPVSEIFDAIN